MTASIMIPNSFMIAVIVHQTTWLGGKTLCIDEVDPGIPRLGCCRHWSVKLHIKRMEQAVCGFKKLHSVVARDLSDTNDKIREFEKQTKCKHAHT